VRGRLSIVQDQIIKSERINGREVNSAFEGQKISVGGKFDSFEELSLNCGKLIKK
jgi:hypothetical protein